MDRKTYEANLFEKIIATLKQNGFDACCESLILTGSLGRNEPTYHLVDGEPVLKSDIELGVVFQSGKKSAAETMIAATSSYFKEDLNFMVLSRPRIERAQNFNFAVLPSKCKTIFTYDLYHGSRTLYGKKLIENVDVPLASIDPYEAKRIVSNRIGEMLYHMEQRDEALVPIWRGKVLLAVASAYLLLNGKYQTAYHAQRDALLRDKAAVAALLSPAFIEDYLQAFAFLRQGAAQFECPDERLYGYIEAMNALFKQKRLHASKVNSFSRRMKYLLKYLKSGNRSRLFTLEDDILQSLLDNCHQGNERAFAAAKRWHDVLY